MGNFSLADLEYRFWTGLKNGTIGTVGAKGDPGGIVKGTTIGGTTSLDTLKADGVYFSAETGRGTALGYPHVNRTAGVLIVNSWWQDGLDVIQTFTAAQVMTGGPTYNVPATTWQRTLQNGVWSSWRTQTTQRIDQTAGRAIYHFDGVNNREQLIYGDTGWREVPVLSGTIAWARIRRSGNTVHVWISSWANGTSADIIDLPVGFRTGTNSMVGVFGNRADVPVPVNINGPSALIQCTAGASATPLSTVFNYMTLESWPTALPGTAFGTIPNL
jgi:hypothetical protein